YVSMLTLQWLKDNGGVSWIDGVNQQKADLIYNEIDSNPLFVGTAAKEDRSRMNVCFLLNDESLEAEFNEMWAAVNINGIKGHRSVGGYRASIYNAMPLSSVQVLVNVMRDLAKKHA
ncbi:MAG: phosphoserine aminotransferase, partial [Bacteroidia bacterium]